MNAITVYGYDRLTGAYTEPLDAEESPLEPGVYLDPAFTTRSSPPHYGAGEILVWRGDKWTVVADHRGETWYSDSGEPVIVDAPGNPVDLGLSNVPPAQPELPILVPTITPRQLRLWLLSRGLLAQVPMLIDAMPEPDKSVAQIEWEFATVFEHTHPFMQALGSAIGLSSDDIEAGFREAALL